MKTLKMFTVFTALILLAGSAYAGYNGTRGNRWAVGPSTEGLQLYGYQLLPSVDDTIDLGSSTLQFRNGYFDGTVYADGLSVDGSVAMTGAITITGSVTISHDLSVSSTVNLGVSYSTVTANGKTTTINVATTFIELRSSGTVTLSTHIAAGTPVFSTATSNVGDLLEVVSISTYNITFPVGTEHFIVGMDSPTTLGLYDSFTAIFCSDKYWIVKSSRT